MRVERPRAGTGVRESKGMSEIHESRGEDEICPISTGSRATSDDETYVLENSTFVTNDISKITIYFSAFSGFSACHKQRSQKAEKLYHRKCNKLRNYEKYNLHKPIQLCLPPRTPSGPYSGIYKLHIVFMRNDNLWSSRSDVSLSPCQGAQPQQPASRM